MVVEDVGLRPPQRREEVVGDGGIRGLELVLGGANGRFVQAHAVELLGVLEKRLVAPRAHVLDDTPDGFGAASVFQPGSAEKGRERLVSDVLHPHHDLVTINAYHLEEQ